MGFLTDQPDLSDTIFSSADRDYARNYLVSAIARQHSSWLSEPRGPLRAYWLGNGSHQSCYLIELARILSILQTNVTAKSTQPLVQKFRALLCATSVEQFEETLTELQVAWRFLLNLNPNSRIGPSEALFQLFSGERQFHINCE